MSSQPLSATTPFALGTSLDCVSNTSIEVNSGYVNTSDVCRSPGSLPSTYHLHSSCSLTPLSNGPQDSAVADYQASVATPQHEPPSVTTQRETRAEMIRAALASLHIDLSSTVMSKMCVSDRDIQSLQERLMAKNVGNGKNKDGPDSRPLDYEGTTEMVTECDTVDDTWLIHDHLDVSRRNVPGHSACRHKFDPIDEKCPEVSFTGGQFM